MRSNFLLRAAARAGVILMAAAICEPSGWLAADQPAAAAVRQRVYFGTYTRGTESKGIYVADFDSATGQLSNVRLAAEADNPSFLAIHPGGRLLYCVNETADFGGSKPASGSVSAFRIDPSTGLLTLINQQPTRGAAPCHLVVDATGKWLLTANYSGGSACVHPLGPDGSLGGMTSFVQHQGKSVNARRQEAPHAHSINLDAGNRFAFVADLGLDQVLSYHFDAGEGKLAANPSGHGQLTPGSGPRHFAFRLDGRFAFANNELTCTVTSFRYDSDRGALTPIETVSTLPPGTDLRGNSTAECLVHPSGKFVYVSNRGHNSIAVFQMDGDSGRLTRVANESTRGKTPRNFRIDPAGAFLLAENQDSNTVTVFRIDAASGQLTAIDSAAKVPAPVCARFLAVAD